MKSEKLKEQGIKSLQENAMETWENIVAEVRLYKIASLFGHTDMLSREKGKLVVEDTMKPTCF